MKQLIYWIIGKGKFKDFMYWLLGDKATRTILGTWNWLWGIPVESGGKVALEVAKEAVESMKKSIAELTDSVAKVVAAYEAIKTEYEVKQKGFKEAENQALLAYQNGNENAARLAMAKAISLENLLTKIKVKLDQSQKVVTDSKQKLLKEKEKLENHKLDLQSLESISRINESLGKITDFESSLNIEHAQDDFNEASYAIQNKNYQVNAVIELSENPTDKLEMELDKLTRDDEISRRLERLRLNKIDS